MGWFRRRPTFKEQVLSKLNFIELGVQAFNRKANRIMATLEEVQGAIAEGKAAVDEIIVDVGNVITKIEELIAAGGASAADLDGLLAGVQGITAGLKDANAGFDAVAPDAPVEPPVE